eukprot:1140115-Pelagomonas_calceolata.AAC.5
MLWWTLLTQQCLQKRSGLSIDTGTGTQGHTAHAWNSCWHCFTTYESASCIDNEKVASCFDNKKVIHRARM